MREAPQIVLLRSCLAPLQQYSKDQRKAACSFGKALLKILLKRGKASRRWGCPAAQSCKRVNGLKVRFEGGIQRLVP
jgi:hypothetical protein